MMPTNSPFQPQLRSEAIRTQIEKLERLEHQAPVNPKLADFDAETEELLMKLYGETHQYLETYKYASLAEAEALVNLPESAQEPLAQDRPKTAIQQRRQALLGIITDMQEAESREADVLTGEDREDPPGYS
ncbi:MAG TPA: hypothetical protein VIU63_11915 [Nitrospira sp.]